MLSIWLSVIFVGILGHDATRVERQVQSLLHHDAGIDGTKIPAADLRQLTRHSDGSVTVVEKLASDGVIAGELIDAASGVNLRIVMYRPDGSMKSLMEIPLAKRLLTKEDLSVLRTNLEDDIGELVHAAARKPAATVAAAPPKASPQVAAAPPQVFAAAAAPPPAAAATLRVQKPTPAPPPARVEAPPPRIQQPAPTPPPPTPPPPAPRIETPAAHPAVAEITQEKDSDSVSLAELEATTAASPSDTVAGAEVGANATTTRSLRLAASAGFGVTQRSFSPAPASMPAYSSSPVGTAQFDAHVSPAASLGLGVHAETTVAMSSSLASESAPTTMTRWEAVATYTAALGRASLEPVVGFGSRSFKIDSVDPARSPDNDYNYLILGGSLSLPLGHTISMRGSFAFEPVIGGREGAEMAFGDASRWGFDLGAAVEARPWTHVFMRVSAGFQHFSWSWDAAGARGAGGATDSYPSGALALGAEY